MTLTFSFRGSRGDRVLLSFIAAPSPSALQWSSFTPFPRNTTPNLFGSAEADGVSANAFIDSSHGSATVQPTPRRTVRREIGNLVFLFDDFTTSPSCWVSTLTA